MAAPVAATIAKAAVTVVTDKNLRKIVGGILLGIIIVIIAPIAILLSVVNTGQGIDWSSPEMQQQIMDNMTAEEQERLQHFADIMQNIEDEIIAQGLSVEPIKAQVVFLCVLTMRKPILCMLILFPVLLMTQMMKVSFKILPINSMRA